MRCCVIVKEDIFHLIRNLLFLRLSWRLLRLFCGASSCCDHNGLFLIGIKTLAKLKILLESFRQLGTFHDVNKSRNVCLFHNKVHGQVPIQFTILQLEGKNGNGNNNYDKQHPEHFRMKLFFVQEKCSRRISVCVCQWTFSRLSNNSNKLDKTALVGSNTFSLCYTLSLAVPRSPPLSIEFRFSSRSRLHTPGSAVVNWSVYVVKRDGI